MGKIKTATFYFKKILLNEAYFYLTLFTLCKHHNWEITQVIIINLQTLCYMGEELIQPMGSPNILSKLGRSSLRRDHMAFPLPGPF